MNKNQEKMTNHTLEPGSIIIKEAQTRHPVHPLLRRRWSARAFAPQPIAEQTLMTLLEAASWAPSSMNEQPWAYLFAHKGEAAFDLMAECLLPGNRWAKNAPLMLLSLARKTFSTNGKPNRHALHDVGAANAQLLLQAADMDIYGHQMGGFDMDKTLRTFHIPDDLEPVCFIALGYLDDPDTLEEPFRSRELTPRSRKPVEDFAFSGVSLLA